MRINGRFSMEGIQSEKEDHESHVRRSCIKGRKENRDQRAKRRVRSAVVIEANEGSF